MNRTAQHTFTVMLQTKHNTQTSGMLHIHVLRQNKQEQRLSSYYKAECQHTTLKFNHDPDLARRASSEDKGRVWSNVFNIGQVNSSMLDFYDRNPGKSH